jgi:hypothetical protein
LTNTNYYPGILQFFGYMLVETLSEQYGKYYRAVDGNPPFTLQDEQLGAVMNSADLNRSIRDKFRWSLELDPRYFMIARCITMLYFMNEESRVNWQGYSAEEIMQVADAYDIHCLGSISSEEFTTLLDEMVDMGILTRLQGKNYRLRRSTFAEYISKDAEQLEEDIQSHNLEEVSV